MIKLDYRRTHSSQVRRYRPYSPVLDRNDKPSVCIDCTTYKRIRDNDRVNRAGQVHNLLRRCYRRNPFHRRNAKAYSRTACCCIEIRWARTRVDLKVSIVGYIVGWKVVRRWPDKRSSVRTASHLVGAVGTIEFSVADVRFRNAILVAASGLFVLAHLWRPRCWFLDCEY